MSRKRFNGNKTKKKGIDRHEVNNGKNGRGGRGTWVLTEGNEDTNK